MLDLETRTAILKLHRTGHGTKSIAKVLRVSRSAVQRVVRSGEAEVPSLVRDELLGDHVDRVRELHAACKGNLVRVAEELYAEGIEVGYSTLTAFCRRHEIGVKPKERTGRYEFAPGEEMQHDTSPHLVEVGGRLLRLECASIVLCYSRVQYAQCFPRWNRFLARVFLTEALQYFDGAAGRAMIDNSSVIVARGTGPDAEMAPEMDAFADRFGFKFEAHEKGDANRSARVERPFHTIENNFYAGRTFADLDDLNAQLRTWCDKRRRTWTRALGASPQELYVVERPSLDPLPAYVPEVYDLLHRRVDTEGYVNIHRNRYSMPDGFIGRQVSVHEHRHTLRIFDGHQLVLEHAKQEFGAGKRITLPEHRYRRKRQPDPPLPEEGALRAAAPELSALVDALRKRHGGRAAKQVRRLHRMYLEYDTESVVAAVATALDYGLVDLSRIETMVLRHIAGDFFRLPNPSDEDEDG
jgi:transposase